MAGTFAFMTAARICFGRGALKEELPGALGLGTRACVVTGSSRERCAVVFEALSEKGMASLPIAIPREPEIEALAEAAARARAWGADMVLAMGGGSVLDAGKALAALLTNRGDIRRYLEVIGDAAPLEVPSAPCVAIPTTAGTGSEVTRNAVLRCPDHRVKVSCEAPSCCRAWPSWTPS